MAYDPQQARAFIVGVGENPELSSPAVRTMTWLLALCEKVESDTVEIFYTAFWKGYSRDGIELAGSRHFSGHIVRHAIRELEEHGLIENVEKEISPGMSLRTITVTV